MPCGCFGKKAKESPKKVPPNDVITSDLKVKPEDGPATKGKGGDGVASDPGNTECPLLGYRPTGSRPPSSYVDSPTSNSHTHTPSTIPVIASSGSSQASSMGSSPSSSRQEAYTRALLAEKRREFFRDFLPEEKRHGGAPRENLPSTLPTVARARQFGKVRNMRPVSQPSATDPPVPPDAPPPPGPHLLHASPRVSPKTEGEDGGEGGFASPDFLCELKSASSEIHRRWAMSDEERDALPSSLKMRVVTPEETLDEGAAPPHAAASAPPADQASFNPLSASSHSSSPVNGLEDPPPLSLRSQSSSSAAGVPETLVTPPSPPRVEFPPAPAHQDYHREDSPPASDEGEVVCEFPGNFELSPLEEESFDLSDQPGLEGEGEGSTGATWAAPVVTHPVEEEDCSFLIENKSAEDSFEFQGDFGTQGNLDALREISELDDDSFDLSDAPGLDGGGVDFGTAFMNPHAQGGALFSLSTSTGFENRTIQEEEEDEEEEEEEEKEKEEERRKVERMNRNNAREEIATGRQADDIAQTMPLNEHF